MSRCEEVIANHKSPRDGEQCKRAAVVGAAHCAVHGGIEEANLPPRQSMMRFRKKCRAVKKDGEPCGNYAIHGGTVCSVHGGSAPQVKKAAKERLLEMVDPAMAELMRIITKKDTSDSDRIRAIQIVLDRTGYHARAEISAEIKPWMKLVEGTGEMSILRDVPEEENVIDAEVVDDEVDPMELPEVRAARDALARRNATGDKFEVEPLPGIAPVVPISSFRNPPGHLR